MKKQAIITTGLQYGDEAKGSIVDFLTRQNKAHTVIRYNGGAQAAHNVVTPYGEHHTFAQFGSGTLAGAKTYLSRFMLIDPLSLLNEADHLDVMGIKNPYLLLSADYRALIITPFHQIANKIKEIARGNNRHGSCGMGIGETVGDAHAHPNSALRASDLLDVKNLKKKLQFFQELKKDEIENEILVLADDPYVSRQAKILCDPHFINYCIDVYHQVGLLMQIVDESYLKKLYRQDGTIIFEGAQGALLDEAFGFHPYTTWSTTTPQNARSLLNRYEGNVTTLGLVRTYGTRHGPGPFVTEDASLTRYISEPHNQDNRWQRGFRIGHLDLVALKYACQISQRIDYLAVSHIDQLRNLPNWKIATAYRYSGAAQDLGTYFTLQDGYITGIKAPPKCDLIYQERLTQLLQECEPIYTSTTSRDIAIFLEYFANKLAIPIGIISAGPTANDKRVLQEI